MKSRRPRPPSAQPIRSQPNRRARWSAPGGASDAAEIAAHYGSVSAVTFVAAQQFVGALGLRAEGFMTLLTALEAPEIAVALAIGSTALEEYGVAPRAGS